MDIKKLFILSLIEFMFFVLIISSLLLIRHQQKVYIDELQLYTPEVAKIQENVAAKNLTYESQLTLEKTLGEVEKITDKSLFLTRYVTPLLFIVLFVLFQILYWYFAVKTPWKSVLLPAIVQAVLLLFVAVYTIDLLDNLLYKMPNNAVYYLIAAFILLVLVTLFNFHYFIGSQPFKLTLKKFLHSELKLWFNIILTLVILAAVLLLAAIAYVFSYVGLSIASAVIVLAVFIVIANIHRTYLIDKLLVEKVNALMKPLPRRR